MCIAAPTGRLGDYRSVRSVQTYLFYLVLRLTKCDVPSSSCTSGRKMTTGLVVLCDLARIAVGTAQLIYCLQGLNVLNSLGMNGRK